jgi:hypothetical protein
MTKKGTAAKRRMVGAKGSVPPAPSGEGAALS